MITWMQRHRRYLVITIWISTIAFIGAGFVGWGQYNYNDKAGSVAKVGDIAITSGEFQKAYSNLFNQYNQLFQGKLDEQQAKQFGLPKQAMKSLINQALILNLAAEYDLEVSDEELRKTIQAQSAFTKDGVFDKNVYSAVLSQNNLTKKEYEEAMRRDLLIQKTLYLFTPGVQAVEVKAIASAIGVADKISYKVLTPSMVSSSNDTAAIKAFWEQHKNEYKTEPTYDLSFVRSSILKDKDEQTNEKEALRLYIDFKKGTLDPSVNVNKMVLTSSTTLFSPDQIKEIIALNPEKPFLKPRLVGNEYFIIKLDRINTPRIKTYEEALSQATTAYMAQEKQTKLLELAQNTYKSFEGSVSDFVTHNDAAKLTGLSSAEAAEFVDKLFSSKSKQGFLTLKSGNVILYNILEQKLLQDTGVADENTVMKLKDNLLNEKLLKKLTQKYPVEIYVEGI